MQYVCSLSEDSWDLPNSTDNNPRKTSGGRDRVRFLRQPYSFANYLTRKKPTGSDLSLQNLFVSAKEERGGGGKRVTFNDQFAVFSSPLQKQIRICTFTVSLPQRREMFSSINIWSGLSHLENLVEEEINFKSLDLLLVSGEPYWTQKRDFPGKLREH